MELFQNEIIEHWLSYTIELAQRFSIIVVIAFALIQREWLRKALMEAKLKWQQRLITMFVFGGIAVVGTLSGVVVDLHDLGQSAPHLSNLSSGLQDSEAIVGFRDTMTMMAGLIGGTWGRLGRWFDCRHPSLQLRWFCWTCQRLRHSRDRTLCW